MPFWAAGNPSATSQANGLGNSQNKAQSPLAGPGAPLFPQCLPPSLHAWDTHPLRAPFPSVFHFGSVGKLEARSPVSTTLSGCNPGSDHMS